MNAAAADETDDVTAGDTTEKADTASGESTLIAASTKIAVEPLIMVDLLNYCLLTQLRLYLPSWK